MSGSWYPDIAYKQVQHLEQLSKFLAVTYLGDTLGSIGIGTTCRWCLNEPELVKNHMTIIERRAGTYLEVAFSSHVAFAFAGNCRIDGEDDALETIFLHSSK